MTARDLRLLILFLKMKLGKSGSKNQNTKWHAITLFILLLFIGFSIADLTIIYFRDLMLPTQAPPRKTQSASSRQSFDKSQYSIFSNRNLFSSTGEMPTAITAGKSEKKKENDPVPSSLPIGVIGTLVHSDPAKSIAALELKGRNKSGSYTVGADVEGLCTVERVARNVVYIRNSSNGMLEYIEMTKGANKVAFDTAKAASGPVAKSVQSSGNNQFTLSRATLVKYTNDLSSILMQARAVPNRDPNTGEINGFRILDMQPGSIYEELGLQRMDVIKGVNGEPVDSIQKAMEMYNTLKNGSQVKMQIERGGKVDTFTYDIK
jgi:general secretion pathway protein C